MGNWLDLFVPKDAAALWTAASALATATAAWFTYRAVVYASAALTLEQRPTVFLERNGDRAVLHNVGRGAAFAIIVTDDDGRLLTSVSVIEPDGIAELPRPSVSWDEAFHVYAQDSAGRWWRMRAVYDGLKWSDGMGYTNRVLGRVGAWHIPRDARRQLRRKAESSSDVYRAYSRPLSIRRWTARADRMWTRIRIGIPKLFAQVLERRRVQRYGSRSDRAVVRPVPEKDRAAWIVDVTQYAECWKGHRDINQLSCDVEESGDVWCEVEVRDVHGQATRGLVRISADARRRLPSEPDVLKELVSARFGSYICRLRPDSRFVFSLRTLGPFVVNWP